MRFSSNSYKPWTMRTIRQNRDRITNAMSVYIVPSRSSFSFSVLFMCEISHTTKVSVISERNTTAQSNLCQGSAKKFGIAQIFNNNSTAKMHRMTTLQKWHVCTI